MAAVSVLVCGDASARWAGHIERVVLNVGSPAAASVHLSSGEAWALAAELIAAADRADFVDSTAA